MAEKYKLSDDGLTITDSTTSLMWAVEALPLMPQEKSFLAAKASTLSCYTDWRVPTAHELHSIVDHSRSSPACDPIFQTNPSGYWTSTDYKADPAFAWFVHFNFGYTNADLKPNDYFVRLVRSGQ